MKASTKVQMAVLAGALCALVAVPALAFAGPVVQMELGIHEMAVHEVAGAGLVADEAPAIQHVEMAISPELLQGIVDSPDVATIPDGGSEAPPYPDDEYEEGPVIEDGGGEEIVPPVEAQDDGSDGIVSQQATPPAPTTPRVPRRPYLPYTGGNSLGWILSGLAVAALGVALAAAGYGAGTRRANES